MNPADVSSAGSTLGTIAIGAAPVLVPLFGLLGYGARQAHRHARAWQQAAEQAASSARRSSLIPTRRGLSGTYRGRAITAAEQQGVVRVDVRAANPARLLDEISSRAPLPDTPWLGASARERLSSLTATVRERRQSWLVHVQDRTVTLICGGVPPNSERLHALLDLSCDLAEGIDQVAASPPSPHRLALR
jgi:hypothetical protein